MRASIIIPVYNAEKYIEKCIESILPQLTKEDELILINASSTDNSKKICETFAEQNSGVIVYTIENAGPSKSRNEGIKRAKGDYILFIDADDYVEKNYVSKMLSEVEENEMVICSYYRIQEESQEKFEKKYCNQTKVISKEKMIELYEKELLSIVWNKIYKRELIEKYNILFDEAITKGEDLLFNLDYVQYIDKLKVLPDKLYYYISKKTGINRSFKEPLENRLSRTKRMYYAFIKATNVQNKETIIQNIVDMNFLHLRNYIKEEKIHNPLEILKVLKNKTNLDYIFKEDNSNSEIEVLKKMYEKNHILRMYVKNKLTLRKRK